MENKKKNIQNESETGKPIWKTEHTPLKERKTSSGITFWPKKVIKDEQT